MELRDIPVIDPDRLSGFCVVVFLLSFVGFSLGVAIGYAFTVWGW